MSQMHSQRLQASLIIRRNFNHQTLPLCWIHYDVDLHINLQTAVVNHDLQRPDVQEKNTLNNS